MKDELNPKYIFDMTDSSLLIDAINGKIDLNVLAIKELACRGLNRQGVWVGFEIANELAEQSISLLKG